MKKWIFSLALLISFSTHSASIPQVFTPDEAGYLNPDLVETQTLRVVPMEVKGFSGTSLTKLKTAFTVLEQVMNSQEFKDRVINFKNSKGERAFASNDNMTNEDIYTLLMEGREKLQPDTVGEMNYFLKLYNNPFSPVIGQTNGRVNLIKVNWKFFKNFKPNEVAGNLAHEWLHKMGFDHASAKEHDSVPYAVGYIVREMATNLLLARELH